MGFIFILVLVSIVNSEFNGDESKQEESYYEKRIQFQKPLVPIILVPGIAGSIMWAKTSSRDDQRIWVSVIGVDQWYAKNNQTRIRQLLTSSKTQNSFTIFVMRVEFKKLIFLGYTIWIFITKLCMFHII